MPNTVASRRLIAAGCRVEQRPLHFDLVAAVERHRPNRRLLGAELSCLADAVPAVGDRQNDALIAAEQRQHVDDRLFVRRGCGERIAIAQRGTDQRGKRNDDVGLLHERPHRLDRSHIAADDRKVRVIADARQAVLPVHELSTTATAQPRSSSAGTSTDPRYPAPPVTRTFVIDLREPSKGVRPHPALCEGGRSLR